MGEVEHYKVGDTIYIYFGDAFRAYLRKSAIKQKIYFAEFRVIYGIGDKEEGRPEGSITAIHGDRLFKKSAPYEGCGIWIYPDNKHIFSEDDFFNMREASNDELESMCESCGFKKKEFMKAFKPFRVKKEKSNQ